MTNLRDIWLVSQFEVLRAIRTWRALALFLLYGIAYAGSSYIFIKILQGMENSFARSLGVANTGAPGALTGSFVKSESFRAMIKGMTGNEGLMNELISLSPLAIFAMWLGLLLVPFFASSAAAECISIDLRSRAIRFEVLRTGRVELLLGRFLGQLFLTAVASFVAVLVVYAAGMLGMVGHHPVFFGFSLLLMTFKAWCFSVPFGGLGVAASTFTASPAWARILAIGATAGSWVLYLFARIFEDSKYGIVSDLLLQILPQGWMHGLWNPGFGWIPSALVCFTLGVAAVSLGAARFLTRDL